MDINFEKGVVSLYGKNTKLDTLIKKFTQLSGEQVYHFLSNRGIQLPRRLNSLALISVLNRRIKFLHSNSLSKDYFSRLQYYKYFTEQQLFNLFKKICNDDNSYFAYRYNFFKLLLANFVGMNLNDGELTYLKNVKKSQVESFEQYFNYISGAALEQEDTFDGQLIDILKEKLTVTASNQEIYDLAGKYGIDIPARLKKEDYLAFIFYYMKKNNTYNDEIAEELSLMTMGQLTTYARRTGVPMQPTMAKQELVTYLFYYLEQCQIEQTSVRRLEISDEYQPLEFTVDLTAVSTFGSDELKKVIHYEGEENDTEEFNQVLIDEAIDDDDEIVDDDSQLEVESEKEDNAESDVASDAVLDDSESSKFEEDSVVESSEEVNEEVDATEEIAEEVQEVVEEPQVEDVADEVVEELQVEEVTDEVVEGTPIVDEATLVEEEPEEAVEEIVEIQEEIVEEVEYVYSDEDQEYIEETIEDKNDETLVDEDYVDDETIARMLAESNAPEEEAPKTVVGDFENVKKNEYYGSEKIEKLAQGPGKIITLSICGGIALAVLVFCIWALLV